jgi:hypothetical protein
MQTLDSFISPIHGFDDDILILAILISAWPPRDEPMSDPSAGASAGTSKIQVGKLKATANTTPQKKDKKAMGRFSSEIKINEPTRKAPALTPPSGPR